MINNEHPILKLLREAPYEFHLIGSRFVGPHDPEKADYDFIMVCKQSFIKKHGPRDWLKQHGFKPQGEYSYGYGPDKRLLGTCVCTRKDEGWPSVDLLPMTEKEADMRLKFFEVMRGLGHERGGWLSKALKSQKPGWPALWDCFAKLLEKQ